MSPRRNSRGTSRSAPVLVAAAALVVGAGAWLIHGSPGAPEVTGVAPPTPDRARAPTTHDLGGSAVGAADDHGSGVTPRRALDGGVADPFARAGGEPLAGRVVDGRSGRGVPGAQVALTVGPHRVTAASDAEGAFELLLPAEGDPTLAVRHPEYVDLFRPRVDLGEEPVIALERSGSIVGRLLGVDPDGGQPRVGLWVSDTGRLRGDPLAQVAAEEGRFLFDDLRPGNYAVGVGGRELPMVLEAGVVVRPGIETSVVIAFDRGLVLDGRVVLRGSHEPVADAQVRVQPELQGIGDVLEELARREVTSAPDGSFRIERLGAGGLELSVRTPWGAQLGRTIALTEGRRSAEELIEVPAPAFVSGRVVDGSGRGVAGAWVIHGLAREVSELVGDLVGSLDELSRVRTDDEGRFDLGAVPARERLLLVATPPVQDSGFLGGGSVGANAALVLKEGEARAGVTLMLVPTRTLTGRVVDAAGSPLADVPVVLQVRTGGQWTRLDGTSTWAEGNFELKAVPQGARVLVSAAAEGYRPAVERVQVSEANEPLELVLEDAYVIRGHVVDEGGWAVPGARVRARLGPWEGAEENARRRSATADDFGRFTLESLDEGSWTVDAWAVGHELPPGSQATVSLPGEAYVILVMGERALEAPGTISGELLMKGSGLPVEGLVLEGTRGGSVLLQGTRFTVTGVRPGRLRLLAKAPGVELVVFPAVQVSPGARVDLGVHETRHTSRLVVQVVDPLGQPVAGVQVRLERLVVEPDPGVYVPKKIDLKPQAKGGPGAARFVRDGVGRYEWRLRVVHRAWDPHFQTIRLAEPRHMVRVRLAPRGSSKKKKKGG